MKLLDLGWRPFFQKSFDSSSNHELRPARVIQHHKQRYVIHDGEIERSATVLGRLLYEEDAKSGLPAIGDWVCVQPFDDEAVIHEVLPRQTAFYRKSVGTLTRQHVIAANIDVAFLVSGLDNDFNVRRIERYLVQCSSSGSKPVIVLNKTDLCDDLESVHREIERIAMGIDVIALSAKENHNIDHLRPYLAEGQTVVFLGSSGVGKSSLVNRLLGFEHLQTNSVREDDSRGRHTTSHRELVFAPGGGLIIDTPGLRELQLWGDEEDLSVVFQDIEEYGEECRFNDCQHVSEPGCNVLQALENGELDEDRFNSYQKLKKELAYLASRQGELAQYNMRKKDKDFGKMVKQMKKNHPKY